MCAHTHLISATSTGMLTLYFYHFKDLGLNFLVNFS